MDCFKKSLSENSNIVILGGGMTAQIAAFYLKEFNPQIICENGLSQKRYTSWFLWDRPETKKLIWDLDLIPKVRKIRVGYFFNGKIYPSSTKTMRNMYSLKTRGFIVPDSMNKGVNQFIAFDYSSDEIFKALQKKLGCFYAVSNIEKIDLESKIIKTETAGTFPYDILISTIPRPEFDELAGLNFREYYYNSVGIVVAENVLDTEDYDIVYFPEFSIPYYRAVKLNNRQWTVEFIVQRKTDRLTDFIKYGKIRPPYVFNQELKDKNVFFVGRFAAWRGGYTMTNSIRDILHLKRMLGA